MAGEEAASPSRASPAGPSSSAGSSPSGTASGYLARVREKIEELAGTDPQRGSKLQQRVSDAERAVEILDWHRAAAALEPARQALLEAAQRAPTSCAGTCMPPSRTM